MTDYYYTKDGTDEWTVHGRRHHIQIDRTEAPTGRADEYGEDILQQIYHVHDRSRIIDTSDQYDTDPHGFTRLKDAVRYSIEKLREYDGRVDPAKKARHNPRESRVFRELFQDWDALQTFTNYGRGTPEGIAAFVRRYEIQDDLDGWIENKYAKLIDEYATLNDISFEQAEKTLFRRPVLRPPPPPTRSKDDEDPFKFHLKPEGWTGAPCPICGCATKNLRARHRALKADEAFMYGGPYLKRVKVAFGTDFSDELLRE